MEGGHRLTGDKLVLLNPPRPRTKAGLFLRNTAKNGIVRKITLFLVSATSCATRIWGKSRKIFQKKRKYLLTHGQYRDYSKLKIVSILY